jgi:hypothetical protein
MDTACAITIASLMGGGCLIFSAIIFWNCDCCNTNTNTVTPTITPAIEYITIEKILYEKLINTPPVYQEIAPELQMNPSVTPPPPVYENEIGTI